MYSIHKYLDKRQDKLRDQAITKSINDHKKRIKALPVGTKVIATHGRKANSTGIIKKHGRKYAKVDFNDGYIWSIPYNWLDERIDNPSVKENARLNAEVSPMLNKLFAEVMEGE